LEGEAVPYELEFPGSAAKVVYPFNLAEAFERLGNAGYGHHFAIAQGHIGDDLAEWCRLTQIDYLLIQ
jgi:L-arabinose isomerase